MVCTSKLMVLSFVIWLHFHEPGYVDRVCVLRVGSSPGEHDYWKNRRCIVFPPIKGRSGASGPGSRGPVCAQTNSTGTRDRRSASPRPLTGVLWNPSRGGNGHSPVGPGGASVVAVFVGTRYFLITKSDK